MSSRIFQSVIVRVKEATDCGLGVIDNEGIIVADSDLSLIGTKIEPMPDFAPEFTDQTIVFEDRTFRIFPNAGTQFDYAVYTDGTDRFARTVCLMTFIAISEAQLYYEQNHDKSTFIKNIISDNILPGDIYTRSKELSLEPDALRAVILVRHAGISETSVLQCLSALFPDNRNDFIFSVSDTDTVLVVEIPAPEDTKYAPQLAKKIEQELQREFSSKCVIGISTPVHFLRDLADKFKETQVAIDIGRVFETEKTILNYENLGISRLIYQLPIKLCEMFLSEVFKKNPIEALDAETLYTINKFFENNLNVSETSRKLFVHRNTLVYRLEKIKKITGLDLREFDHAIVFKVALMVKMYLNSKEKTT